MRQPLDLCYGFFRSGSEDGAEVHGVRHGHQCVQESNDQRAGVNLARLLEETSGDDGAEGDQDNQREQVHDTHGVEGEGAVRYDPVVLDEDQNADTEDVAKATDHQCDPLWPAFDAVAAVDEQGVH